MDEHTERELIERFRAGDREAFEPLVEECRARVYRVAFRMAGEAEEAEALVQDVFVQAFESLDRFDGRARLMTWLYAITGRKAIDRRRARQRRPAVSLEETADPAFDARRGPAPDPAETAHVKELDRLLSDAMLQLPPDQRAALTLVVHEGLSYRDAAHALGCSRQTVAWRVWSARQNLRTKLQRHLT